MVTFTTRGSIAIAQPVFHKVEAEMKGGFAVNASRTALVEAEVLLDYRSEHLSLCRGDKVLLRGSAGLHPWAKDKMAWGKLEFVLCPESAVVAYVKQS
jgi:hypothetical protein